MNVSETMGHVDTFAGHVYVSVQRTHIGDGHVPVLNVSNTSSPSERWWASCPRRLTNARFSQPMSPKKLQEISAPEALAYQRDGLPAHRLVFRRPYDS